MRPLIGITTRVRDVQNSAGVVPTHTLNVAYTDAVVQAGGAAVLLPPSPDGAAPAIVERLDGLVLSGGGDIEPAAYGGSVHDSMYDIDPERDRFEFALVREAAAHRLPTLAICRGMQVVNVALGGSLIEDVPSQIGTPVQHSRTGEHVYERHQRVELEPGSRVADAVGTELFVNSIHHQAVRVPASCLRVVGRAEDGIVEALQHEDPAWPLWAVQWHPEYLNVRDATALRLFSALVDAARAHAPIA